LRAFYARLYTNQQALSLNGGLTFFLPLIYCGYLMKGVYMKEFRPVYSLAWLIKNIVWAAILLAAFYIGCSWFIPLVNRIAGGH